MEVHMRTAILVAVTLLSCEGPDYTLSALDTALPSVDPELGDDLEMEPSEHAGGSALAGWEDAPSGMVEELHEVGEGSENPVTDFLFVIDDSVSMGEALGRFRAGIDSLADPSVWPSDARIAVMNTTPGVRGNASQLHPAVHSREIFLSAPGFLRLVDAEGLAAYRELLPPEHASHLREEGCEAWFQPGERNAQGVLCLRAHTQLALTDQRVEAGLHAVSQFMQRRSRAAVFRPGAAANVVFISDTHDPGVHVDELAPGQAYLVDELLENQPTYESLVQRLSHFHTLSSFRVHAVAPEMECGESLADLPPSYFTAAEASGGVTADLCSTFDYAEVIAEIATLGSQRTAPVVALGRQAESVEGVLVDGVSVAYSLSPDGRALRVEEPVRPGAVAKVLYAQVEDTAELKPVDAGPEVLEGSGEEGGNAPLEVEPMPPALNRFELDLGENPAPRGLDDGSAAEG